MMKLLILLKQFNTSLICLSFFILIIYLYKNIKKYKNVPLNESKDIKKITIKIVACVIIELIFIIGLNSARNNAIFEKGECFSQLAVINTEPNEEWHKPFLAKEVEYIILKIGTKNYYVSSTIPSLEDFPISDDYKVKKTNCDTLFKRSN